MLKLDDIDKRLMRELQADARISSAALSRMVNLKEGAVRRRIDNLVKGGALRIVGVSDPDTLGLRTHAVIGMRITADQVEPLLLRFAEMREFSYVYQTIGQFDIMAVGFFPSNEQMRSFLLETLAPIEGVLETQTFLIMKTAKRSYRWGQSGEPTETKYINDDSASLIHGSRPERGAPDAP